MKHGDKRKIARETGLSAGYISYYFNGKSGASDKTITKINKAISKLKINIEENSTFSLYKIKKTRYPDRWDIYNNLPHGAEITIAKEVNCSKAYITYVLQGKRKDTLGVVKRAELMAAINIWKTRFCKHKTQL